MEDLTGKQFGPYRIVARLGEGGMAFVYKAYQPGVDRHVALKVLPQHLASEAEFLGRFEQEAKVLARLQHPHILPVFDYGTVDGYTYIVMPFVESGTLSSLLQDTPLPVPQMAKIISQVGDALEYAHSQGLIHRDIKPSNILIDERGNCLLTDFGIARVYEATSRFTSTGGIIGTPAYMAPEQGLGEEVTKQADVYALGILLYQMATGRVPFRAETPIAVVMKHVHAPLPPPSAVNPELPSAVERVILKAVAKKPEDRFATAGDMVQAMTDAAYKADQVAAQPTLVEEIPQLGVPSPYRRFLRIGIVALLLLLVGGALFAVFGRGERDDASSRDQNGVLPEGENISLPAIGETPTPSPLPAPTMTPALSPSVTPSETEDQSTATPRPSSTATETPLPTATLAQLPLLTPTVSPNIVAQRAPAPPTIDGVLDEWRGVPAFGANHLVYQDTGWDQTEDVYPVWRLMWDDENLYIGVAVHDDRHVQRWTDNEAFKGDSVELQIDTDPYSDMGVPELSPDEFAVLLSPGDFASLPPVAIRLRGDLRDYFLLFPEHQIAVAAQAASDGYTIEAAVPWSDIDVTPRSGLIMGAALNTSDNDTPGATEQEVAVSSIEDRVHSDPTTWGMLTLE